MRQNVITVSFDDKEEAKKAFQGIQAHSSTNGYEIHQAVLVTRDGQECRNLARFVPGTLTRSHIFSDWAIGVLLGILFGLKGFLIGGFLGLLAGTLYDTFQAWHDAKLIEEAGMTCDNHAVSMVMIASEYYEDALNQQLQMSSRNVHRAYTGDLLEEIKEKRLPYPSIN